MTQEYTPVAWQDETTSQQGTLINAERLNQMQQAHHYADGFEEVDTIPTADPGVSYHKIVYCTADSTIYRWDGTEWTADIDDETKALLQQEIARATQAESTLRGQLEDEHDARVDAEAAINDRITDEATELAQRIATEASARETADTALGTRITNEASARETADTNLGNRITAEATARSEADTALSGRIDTEQARAEAAEQTNAQAIANTYTKAETDTLLATKLDTLSTTGLHAYTHNGATQSEVSVIDGTTASTIPIRDANGRMQGADPASGATDKTFTTANWISQTGAGRPNNLLHDTGNEDINGIKNVLGRINGLSNINNGRLYAYHGSGDYWRKKINILQDTSWCAMFLIKSAVKRGINGPAIFVYQRRAGAADFLDWIYKPASVSIQVGIKDDGIYVYQNGSDGTSIELLGEVASQTAAANIISISDDSVATDTTFRVTI